VPSSWERGARLAKQHPISFSLTLFLAMAAAHVTAATTHLVSMEVIEGLVSTSRKWTTVAVMWIEAVINVAVEVVRAVEPASGSDEDAAGEPLGSVVPNRCSPPISPQMAIRICLQ
jgi:hypothetical protein